MSKYNVYARDLDDTMKALQAAYAEKREMLARLRNWQPGETDPVKLEAEKLHHKAELMTAEEDMKAFEKSLDSQIRGKIKALRSALESTVSREFMANPAQIDNNTMTLLNSGILSSYEYANLYNEASAKGNHTMMRIIGASAAERAKAADAAKDHNGSEAFNAIYQASKSVNGDSILAGFDKFADPATRCIRTPAMLDQWERMTADAVENF